MYIEKPKERKNSKVTQGEEQSIMDSKVMIYASAAIVLLLDLFIISQQRLRK
ncbi:hypothetical protein L873DRAFT_1808814 [Choiromyces venosus 120613-1]|uniref:Uncharacterized protein n=1 Tax=Choiromyces venosus 120613-1 TaxID=1336337 RepID=A0A3N4JIX6_9PEZI|nr:hypothetical protein L873DRAFT_1808814 [Choiromyces venosus 120613-1]